LEENEVKKIELLKNAESLKLSSILERESDQLKLLSDLNRSHAASNVEIMSDAEKDSAKDELARLKVKFDEEVTVIQKAIDDCRKSKVASEEKINRLQRDVDNLSKKLRGEYLLLLDNLDSQTRVKFAYFPVILRFISSLDSMFVQVDFKAGVRKFRTLVWHYPKNCTDLVQVVDAGLAREIKRLIAHFFSVWLEDDNNLTKWEDGELSASDRRIIMTVWLAEAWATVQREMQLVRLWEKTGSLMKIDGSDLDKIKPSGLEGYVITKEELEAHVDAVQGKAFIAVFTSCVNLFCCFA
jgi:hypothetical protein